MTLQELLRSRWCRWAQRSSTAPTLATDYVVAHRLAQAIARRLYPKAIVAPPLPFGFSHHHTGFAGTITIEPETFAAVCIDIARSLKRDGVRRLLFVNGHQGNNAILNVVTNKIYYELGLPLLQVSISPKQPIVLKRTAKLHESVMPAKSRPAFSCI